MMKQSFMMAKIDTFYAIFGRPLLNLLSVVISLRYLLMKFETNKGVESIRGDQIEGRKGIIMMARIVIG